MKQALNATFFGLKLGVGNDTLMTILLIAEVVVCVLLVVLMIYILCSKKLTDIVRETVIKSADKTAPSSQSGTEGLKKVSSDETKKTGSVALPAAPVKTQYGRKAPYGAQGGTYANRNSVSIRPYVLPAIVLPPIRINMPFETKETIYTAQAKDQTRK